MGSATDRIREEADGRPEQLRVRQIPPGPGAALAVHAGAGGRITELDAEGRAAFEAGLQAAHRAGEAVLDAGGPAVDAVCAAVCALEDDPLFNAGRGAALTADGSAELDAAVMSGDGRAGAVALVRQAKNPVLLARAVLERSAHVLMAAPGADLITGWDLELVDPDYFVTEARRAQLDRILASAAPGPRHGTVGAVARDTAGGLAAATSTGGIAGQWQGRVGDTPVIGAGTYARDRTAAVSGTGHGEAFLRGVLAHDIAARVRYLGIGLPEAVGAAITESLTERDSTGGLVAVDASGVVVVARNSAMMFAAYRDETGGLVTET